MDGEAGWWTTSGNIGLPPLARAMGVGRQQQDSPVLSGVPQGTLIGPLLFIIMLSGKNKDILSSKIISFADDTRVYINITQIENSDSLQTDLNYKYLWAINNNMLFNHHKFNYISFSSSMCSINTNVYYSPSLDIITHQKMFLTLVLPCLETVLLMST